MNNYLVKWSIDIEASSAEVAAAMAREIQLRPNSIANVFEVFDDTGNFVQLVDLEKEENL